MKKIPDDELLVALLRYYVLTIRQVMRLYDAAYNNACRVTDQLEAAHWIQNVNPDPKGVKVFALATAGRKYLKRLGHQLPSPLSVPGKKDIGLTPYAMHLQHTLDINDVLISAELVTRKTPTLLRVEWLHERDFKRFPIPAGTRRYMPDGWLRFRMRDERGYYSDQFYLEVDRGTEDTQKLAGKLKLLIDSLPHYQDYFQQRDVPTGVLFVTPSAGRQAELIRLIKRTVGEYQDAFFVTSRNPVTTPPTQFWLLSDSWENPTHGNQRPLTLEVLAG